MEKLNIAIKIVSVKIGQVIKKNVLGVVKLLLFSIICVFHSAFGYIVSYAQYEAFGKKIIVIGDRHIPGHIDQEHGDYFLKFLHKLYQSSKYTAFIIEAHQQNVHQSSDDDSSSLLLLRVASYCNVIQNEQHKILFSDPRLALKSFYKIYLSLRQAVELLSATDSMVIHNNKEQVRKPNEPAQLMHEIDTHVRFFDQKLQNINDLLIKQMMQPVFLRFKTTYHIFSQFFAKYQAETYYDSLIKALEIRKDIKVLEELQEPMLHANLDLADLSFCFNLVDQLALDLSHIVILVGHDHTVRINHLLECMNYKKAHTSVEQAQFKDPLSCSELNSYFELFLS